MHANPNKICEVNRVACATQDIYPIVSDLKQYNFPTPKRIEELQSHCSDHGTKETIDIS